MNWIGSATEYNRIRNVLYNNTVFLNKQGLNTLVSGFDTIFNSFVNFTDEISSIKLMPINIKGDAIGKLKTTRGTTNVPCFHAYNDNYFYLGEAKINPYFNNFADYKGYTQIKVYLPFIGFVDIDTNIFMNKYIQFRITMDYYSGKGLYIIGKTDDESAPNTHRLGEPYRTPVDDADMEIIYTYETDVGVDIPLGTSNFGDIVRNVALGTIKTAVGVGTSIYTNLLPTSSITKFTRTESAGNVRETRTTSASVRENTSNVTSPITEAVNGSIDVLNRLNVSGHGDRITGSASTWDLKGYIKIIYYRPKMLPINNDFLKLYGKPLGSVENLNDMVGYTEVSSVHIHGKDFNTATKSELENLNTLLFGGVIFDDYVYRARYEAKNLHVKNFDVEGYFPEGFIATNISTGAVDIYKSIKISNWSIRFVDYSDNEIIVAHSINNIMVFDYNGFISGSKQQQSKEFMEAFGYYFNIEKYI